MIVCAPLFQQTRLSPVCNRLDMFDRGTTPVETSQRRMPNLDLWVEECARDAAEPETEPDDEERTAGRGRYAVCSAETLDAALDNPSTLLPLVKGRTRKTPSKAAKKKRAKRIRRARELIASLREEIARPGRSLRGDAVMFARWRFLGGGWRDNALDVRALDGVVTAMTTDAARCATVAISTLLRGCARSTESDIVTPGKPYGGAAPCVWGTLALVEFGGTARTVDVSRTLMARRSGKGNPWSQQKASYTPASTDPSDDPPLSGGAAVDARMRALDLPSAFDPAPESLRRASTSLGAGVHVCAARSEIAATLSTVIETASHRLSVPLDAAARSAARRTAQIASLYCSAALGRSVHVVLGDASKPRAGVDHSISLVSAGARTPVCDLDGAEAEAAAFSLKAALGELGISPRGVCTSPIVLRSKPGLGDEGAIQIVRMARAADPSRGVVIVGFGDGVQGALHAQTNPVRSGESSVRTSRGCSPDRIGWWELDLRCGEKPSESA